MHRSREHRGPRGDSLRTPSLPPTATEHARRMPIPRPGLMTPVGTCPPGPGEAPRVLFPWSDPPGQAPSLDREDPSTRGASHDNWLPMTEV